VVITDNGTAQATVTAATTQTGKARKKGWLVTLGTVVVLVAAMGAPPSSASAWPTTKTTAGLGVSVALHEDAAFVIDAVHPRTAAVAATVTASGRRRRSGRGP
jgi:hypothetical protein